MTSERKLESLEKSFSLVIIPLMLSCFQCAFMYIVRHKADFFTLPHFSHSLTQPIEKIPISESFLYAVRITTKKYKYYSIFLSLTHDTQTVCTHLFCEECDHKGLRWIKGDLGCLLSSKFALFCEALMIILFRSL